jgi:hypothetical protein
LVLEVSRGHATFTGTPGQIADMWATGGRSGRLVHHTHLVLTKGDSHRLAEALTGKGVIPLAT